MTRRSKPRAFGDALREVRAEVEPATSLAAVQGAWRAAVGDRIAAQARPLSERDGVITVGCTAATWAQELDLLQDELLARLNALLGPRRVQGLRFVVDSDPAQFSA
jgi:predicted nucleic acid-binding Zn ribbon protein